MSWDSKFRNMPSEPGIVKGILEYREKLGEKLMHMTSEERIAYFNAASEQWHAEYKKEK